MIADVISRNLMTLSSYLYDERDGKHRLFLGGVCTIAGLKLFSPSTKTPEVKIHGESLSKAFVPADNQTTAGLISYLSAEYIGLVDFWCTTELNCQFSTHDDGECQFVGDTMACIYDLFCCVTPPVYSSRLWETLQANLGCYVAVDDELEFKIYPDFDALIESSAAG